LTKINRAAVCGVILCAMKAADIMVTQVVTVAPDAPVREVAKLMVERRISGLPVVDAGGKVLGVVSEGDLIRRPELGTDEQPSSWLRIFLSADDRARDFVKTHGLRAHDVMTKPAICVTPDATLAEVVRLLERHRVKRLPVAQDGKLVGLLTRTDMLRALLARQALPEIDVPRADGEIRQRAMAVLDGAEWGGSAIVNVQVVKGVAHVWGAVDSDDQRRALRVALESVPGVSAVEAHLVRRLPG
jgi:CBS domain-containing protein